jgi:hypothetical protein
MSVNFLYEKYGTNYSGNNKFNYIELNDVVDKETKRLLSKMDFIYNDRSFIINYQYLYFYISKYNNIEIHFQKDNPFNNLYDFEIKKNEDSKHIYIYFLPNEYWKIKNKLMAEEFLFNYIKNPDFLKNKTFMRIIEKDYINNNEFNEIRKYKKKVSVFYLERKKQILKIVELLEEENIKRLYDSVYIFNNVNLEKYPMDYDSYFMMFYIIVSLYVSKLIHIRKSIKKDEIDEDFIINICNKNKILLYESLKKPDLLSSILKLHTTITI